VRVTQQRGFGGVCLSKQETRIRRYHELIDDYVAGGCRGGDLRAVRAELPSAGMGRYTAPDLA
jgi:hypothetical protein